MRSRTKPRDATSAFQPGARVVIAFNPHILEAVNIIATVQAFHPGEGFMNCDLAEVEFTNPKDGVTHVLPFATYNLNAGDPQVFLAAAERHEQQAEDLRRLALALRLAPTKS